jgi:hypothetical protein
MLSLKIKIIIGLLLIAGFGLYTNTVYNKGYDNAVADQLSIENKQLKKYITDNERLVKLVADLEKADTKEAQTNQIVYVENKDAVNQAVEKAIADVKSSNTRLYITIRDYEARAATAELAASTVGAFATRRAELHEETATSLIRITGDADQLAVKYNALQKEVKRIENSIQKRELALADFLKQAGYDF